MFNPFAAFSSNPAAAPAPVVPTPVQPPGTVLPAAPLDGQQNTNTGPNGLIPPGTTVPGTPDASDNANKSPLDAFADLWQTGSPEGEGNEAPVDPMAIDATKLQEHVGKLNFTDSLTPETMQRVVAGGEDAATALMEAMNTVARNVLTQSTLVSNKLAQRSTEHGATNTESLVSKLIKQHALTNNLVTANPIFDNPAVKPVMDGVKAQLIAKYPDATPNQLTEKAQEFVLAMANGLNPQAAPQSPQSAEEFTDFNLFVGDGQ